MTIQEYREYLSRGNPIECYGIKFKFLEDDTVTILNNIQETIVSPKIFMKYKNFVDLEINLTAAVKNLNIYKIKVLRDEARLHTFVLELDTIKKERKKKEDSGIIKAGMRYV